MEKKPRTLSQNASLHKWCTDVATECEAQGIDRKTIVEDLSDGNIPVTMEYIKQVVWFHFMVGMFGVDSTTKLDTTQVTQVEQAVARHLRDTYGMTISWPSQESQAWEAL